MIRRGPRIEDKSRGKATGALPDPTAPTVARAVRSREDGHWRGYIDPMFHKGCMGLLEGVLWRVKKRKFKRDERVSAS